MRVIVTGAGGFVGRHIVRLLLARGDEVIALDNAGEVIPAGTRALVGDIADPALQEKAFAGGCDALIHLATVPGGAAEADPAASRRVNVDAVHDLLDRAAACRNRPRVIYASSIAVLGEHLAPAGVDDSAPVSPHLIYGGHKAMMEPLVATYSNRGAIDGASLRLPGILARPRAPSGMKSAFMSNLFHALKAGEPFTCPTTPEATIWAESVSRCAANFVHALSCDTALLPSTRAVTLPALRFSMGELAAEIARQCKTSITLVSWQPDPALQAAFGNYPPLATPAAQRAGFAADTNLASLVASALATLE
ncbi:MAG: NAD-dependent epimerase/dehydratase family protein [Alteraurantiacibacter sp.]|nr:NAD-dependent epimerase/dehydratase family protein [Alteraurantiacibacter sp.]